MNRIFIYTLFALGVLVQSCCSVAQTPSSENLIPRDVLFDLKDRKEMIKLSPDGERVFYLKHPYQPIPETVIYERSISDLDRESSIEFNAGIAEYEVLNDEELIVRTLSPSGQSVVIYDSQNQSIKEVFNENFRSIKWLAFSKNNQSAAFVAMPFNANPVLFTFHFQSGKMDTMSNVAQGHYPLFFDENLNVVAGERINRETSDKILAWYSDGEWKEIVSYPWSAERFLRPGLKSILGVRSDGSEIYYTDNSNTDRTVLKKFSPQTNQTETLIGEQNADLVPNSFVADETGQPIAISNHYSNRSWTVVEGSKYQEDFRFLNERFRDYQILDVTSNRNFWLIEEMNGGANISYLYDRKNQSARRLFTDHEELEAYSKVNRHYAVVESFDGLKLPIQYYLSDKYDKNNDGLPDAEMPAVLYVHGGPWQGWMEDFWLITRHLQLLADRGYVVVYSQFRGALTYGKDFLDAGNNQWGDGMMKDKVAIADWLVEEKNVAEERIGIFGWSYGGYAALAGAAFSPDTYACAVGLYGPTYLDAPEEENAFGYSPNSLLRIADVSTEEGMDLARRHSPLHYVDDIKIPILMSTGAQDDRVPQMQMDKMADALHDAGKAVTYFVYPNEGHDYAQKESWTSFWSITEPFLKKHLGGAAEPVNQENYSILEMKYDSMN